jgi:hypothetical protein
MLVGRNRNMDPRIAAFFLLPSRTIGLFLSKNNFTAIYEDEKSRELGIGILKQAFWASRKVPKKQPCILLIYLLRGSMLLLTA